MRRQRGTAEQPHDIRGAASKVAPTRQFCERDFGEGQEHRRAEPAVFDPQSIELCVTPHQNDRRARFPCPMQKSSDTPGLGRYRRCIADHEIGGVCAVVQLCLALTEGEAIEPQNRSMPERCAPAFCSVETDGSEIDGRGKFERFLVAPGEMEKGGLLRTGSTSDSEQHDRNRGHARAGVDGLADARRAEPLWQAIGKRAGHGQIGPLVAIGECKWPGAQYRAGFPLRFRIIPGPQCVPSALTQT